MSIRLKILVTGTDLDILVVKQEQPCSQPIQSFEPSRHEEEAKLFWSNLVLDLSDKLAKLSPSIYPQWN